MATIGHKAAINHVLHLSLMKREFCRVDKYIISSFALPIHALFCAGIKFVNCQTEFRLEHRKKNPMMNRTDQKSLANFDTTCSTPFRNTERENIPNCNLSHTIRRSACCLRIPHLHNTEVSNFSRGAYAL